MEETKMKNTHKLAGAALLAAVGLGLAVPSATKAAPEVTGKGKITFTQDLTTNPSNVLPGESSGDELTEPTQNPDPLPLKIVSVTDIDFDSHNIVVNDSDKTYEALPFSDATSGQTGAHFVRYQDVRADTATNFHTISAEMTKQFTNGTFTLDGASLTYKNASLVSGTNKATLPSAAAITPTFDLALNTAQTVVTNKEAGKGFGVFEIMFDTNANAQAGTYDGVTLNVPGTALLKTGEYQAEITWSIADAN